MSRTAEILLYDVIGEDFMGGVSARWFVEQLSELDLRSEDTLVLRVNSPGGSVNDGLAMYNALKAYPARKVARVEGLAASAASFLLQGADEREVAEASFVMIHRAWGLTVGDADAHLTSAAMLEKNDTVLAGIYAARSGKSADEWLASMAEETWYTGPEAVEAGLADRLIAEAPAMDPGMAALHSRALAKLGARRVPESLRGQVFPFRRAAALIPRNAGRALNAENRRRLNEIRTLAQEVLDSDMREDMEEPAEGKKASASAGADATTAAWLHQAALDLMLADCAQAALDAEESEC